MKKIINGKKYDTETAEKVAVWTNDHFCNDFKFEKRRLFKKKTGEFFEHAEGGPHSCLADRTGSSGWGSEINPLTEDQAKWWCEKYASDDYEDIFGEVQE